MGFLPPCFLMQTSTEEVNVSDIMCTLPTEAVQRVFIVRVVNLDNLKFVFVLKDKLFQVFLVIELPHLGGDTDHYVICTLGECQCHEGLLCLLVDIVACLQSLAMIHGKCHESEVACNLTIVVVLCLNSCMCLGLTDVKLKSAIVSV